MIDFGDFINSQRGNVGYPRRKNKKEILEEIRNNPDKIEKAKAKVQRILDSGKMKRKRIKQHKKTDTEE